MNLPYRYDVLMRVTVVGDGIHADGDGVMATARKLATLIAGLDPHVIDVQSFPADVSYLGKTEDLEPSDSPRALGYLDNQAGAEAWRGER